MKENAGLFYGLFQNLRTETNEIQETPR